MPSREELMSIVAYDEKTGLFTRNGKPAGTMRPNGYIQIGIKGHLYRAHRLAWLFVHGVFPEVDVDHINRDRADNRLVNLRLATRSENMRNLSRRSDNTSGATGVTWDISRGKWLATIKLDGYRKNLGRYATLGEAISARTNAEQSFYGTFAPKGELSCQA